MTPYPDTPATWPAWPPGDIQPDSSGGSYVTVPPGDVTPIDVPFIPDDPPPTPPIATTVPLVLMGPIVAQGFVKNVMIWPTIIIYWWEAISYPASIPASYDEAMSRRIWQGENSGAIAFPYHPTPISSFAESSGPVGWTWNSLSSQYSVTERFVEWQCTHTVTTDPYTGDPAHFYRGVWWCYEWIETAWWYHAYIPHPNARLRGVSIIPVLAPLLLLLPGALLGSSLISITAVPTPGRRRRNS